MKNTIIFSRLLYTAVIFYFFLLTQALQAQTKFKQYILPGSLMFVSGMLDGTIESINYHYHNGFKRQVQNANDQFWNPELSWKNKYQNGDPAQGPKFFASTTALVFTTDGYHALRTTRNAVNTFTLVYFINNSCGSKKPFKYKLKKMVVDAVVLTTIRNIGFHTTYSVLFRKK